MTCSHHFKFEINLIRLSNSLDQQLEGNLFIRYYISTLDKRRIQVDTKEIQTTTSNLSLSDFASFECHHANSDLIDQQRKLSDVKFELRMRRNTSGFGRIIARSILLGTAEISWKDLIVSKGMSLEKWLKFSRKGGKLDGIKLPDLLVEMKINRVMKNGISNLKRRCDFRELECDVDMFHVESLID